MKSIQLVVPLLALVGACASDVAGVPGQVDAGSADAYSTPVTPIGCDPPDVMVVLDRTGSMSQRPDGTMPPNSPAGAKETKWHFAISAIKAVVGSLDETIRFGLVLFPLDPDGSGGHDCSNLGTWLAEYLPPESNDLDCQPAEMLVSPTMGAFEQFDGAISRDGTGLCSTTPIGGGLQAAKDGLMDVANGRDQFIFLVTDGADNCDGDNGYNTNSLELADALAAQDVSIYVIGFDGSGEGIDESQLNNLACAGHTAPQFDQNCVVSGGSARAVASPSPSRLFMLAENGTALQDALESVSEEICCGCVD